ncbi:type II toxin-antitoxin system PemK/MazF family toxin [uncultured Ornithinimicrobium sp.]|uniref:type II toxin-antitoxin system PemK/MazF family toxin n=1 Tax=uncultured Ornithinimicrobium sp. TaxID=259307 RepID=UPI00338E04F0
MTDAHGATGDDPPQVGWAPVADDRADPGEVVWAWVPFEEEPQRGKDRPVLVLGRADDTLLALQLTSRDHDLDEEQEAAEGRLWTDIGTGAWDRYRRPSEVRVNRLLRLPSAAVRRTGASVDRHIFEHVLDEAARHLPELGLRRDADAGPPAPPSDGPTPPRP